MQDDERQNANDFDFVGLGASHHPVVRRKIRVDPLDQRNKKCGVAVHSKITKVRECKVAQIRTDEQQIPFEPTEFPPTNGKSMSNSF